MIVRRDGRILWTRVSLLLGAVTLTHAAQLPQGALFQFAIDDGPLTSVLDQLSRQTGLQVVTQLDANGDPAVELQPFYGRATVDEALATILAGTDLTYTRHDESTIAIHANHIEPPSGLENVVEVTGTGLRIESGGGPVRVFEREEIERWGVSSLAEVARSLAPTTAVANEEASDNAQFAPLRYAAWMSVFR